MPQEEEAAGRGESEVQPLIQEHPHVSHQVHDDDHAEDYDEQGEDEAHQVF